MQKKPPAPQNSVPTAKKPTKAQNRQVCRDKLHPDSNAMQLLSELRLHGGMDYLLDYLRSCKLRGLSDDELVDDIKNRYSLFLSDFTREDLKTWVKRDRDIEKAYFSAYEAIGARALHRIYERLNDSEKADNDFLLNVAERYADKEEASSSGTASILASIYKNLSE